MRILLTNDDGIEAPGLAALHAAVGDLGEVRVVAPHDGQSAVGHAITVHGNVEVFPASPPYAPADMSVLGRPADCVKLAFRQLLNDPPELVLSGINAGANVGINVLYSGTVAAAVEAAILGLPAVAFSLEMANHPDFDRAARLCRTLLGRLLSGHLLRPGSALNVNIPSCDGREPAGIRICRQAAGRMIEQYMRVKTASGEAYRLTDVYGFENPPEDTDVAALSEGYITVTPLQPDMTDISRLGELEGLE